MDRLEIAVHIMNGIISADWNLPIPDGKVWDDVAVERAFQLADKIIEESKITTVKPTKKTK